MNKNIQARLQSRIKYRSFEINHYAFKIRCAKGRGDSYQAWELKMLLKSLVESQKLDKDILSNTYWR